MLLHRDSIPKSSFLPGPLHPGWLCLVRDAFLGVRGPVSFVPLLLESGEVFHRAFDDSGLHHAIRTTNDEPYILCQWFNDKPRQPHVGLSGVFHIYTITLTTMSEGENWYRGDIQREWEGGPVFEGITCSYGLNGFAPSPKPLHCYRLEGVVLPWERLERE